MCTIRLIWQMGHVSSRKMKKSYTTVLYKSHAKRSAARLTRRRKNRRDKLAAILVHLIRIEVTQNVLCFILAQLFHLSINKIFNTVSKTFNIGHVPRWTRARSTRICKCDIPLWWSHVEVRTAAVRHNKSYVLWSFSATCFGSIYIKSHHQSDNVPKKITYITLIVVHCPYIVWDLNGI